MSQKNRVPLFDTTEDQTLRIQKELATKIGFNEAVVLMQIEYLISIATNNQREGNWWTYQTLEDLKEKCFPWWSIATISRILKSLEKQELICISSFNKRKGDKTQWFALNIEKVKSLECIKFNDSHPIFHFEKWVGDEEKEEAKPEPESKPEPVQQPILQDEKPHFSKCKTIFQNDGTIFQFETTLPKTSTETPNIDNSPNGEGDKSPPVADVESEKEADQKPQPAPGPKTVVWNRFVESTNLPEPKPKSSTANFWWGKFGEILNICNKDPAYTCTVMDKVIGYMRTEGLTISGPQSIVNLCRSEVAGQLNGASNGRNKPKAIQPSKPGGGKPGALSQARAKQSAAGPAANQGGGGRDSPGSQRNRSGVLAGNQKQSANRRT